MKKIPNNSQQHKRQKDREKGFASQLGVLMGKSWQIEFPENESEGPDLLVKEGPHIFGLEVREITKDTETNKGSNLKATESRNYQKINALAKQYYSKSKIPIKVEIRGPFDEDDDLLNHLFNFAASSNVTQIIKINPQLCIYVTRLDPDKFKQYSFWTAVDNHVGIVRKISSEYLMPFVQEKEKKITKYKTHLEDVRLLLVADRTSSSGMLEMQEENTKIKSQFSEVYFFACPCSAYCLVDPIIT